ncbi:MAG: UvrD-helicase domain-containing protein [Flavobacteriales bacterium]|nr:UvrD-helicase domain-containing protein [Flavobacteriales bacterium]
MFTVLRSSAGAGKTHALVKRYLGHCLKGDNVAAYRQVLALTFTNKAAGEMKVRVVGYLEKLSGTEVLDGTLRDVMDYLTVECNTDERTIAVRAHAVRKHMLHHWSEVAISTIDAFTRRVVQPFARDLQLDHDLRMTTEEEWYRDHAVDMLIAEAGVDAKVTALLTEACRQLLEDERAWDPGAPLRDLAQELSKENAIVPLRTLHALEPEQLRPLSDRLRKENRDLMRSIRGTGIQALELIAGAGLDVADLYQTKSGFHGWFRKLATFGDSWLAPGANVLKTFEENKWTSAKAVPSAKSIIERLAPRLTYLYQEGNRLLEGQRDYFIRKAVLREIAPAFALRELDRCLTELKRTDGVVFFSDLTRRVAEVVRDEPVPFIYERLGERYRHFLIDEFQDTSLMQWNTLLPLIDNALAQGGTALLVGDAKQAIYRWRNGEVRLFSNLPKLFGSESDPLGHEREQVLERHWLDSAPLNDNRRSADTIVHFNNALFADLARALPEEFQGIYDAHEQHPCRNAEGLVVLERLGKELSGEEAQEATVSFALRCLREAIADGFVPGDVGVLVRSRRIGRAIAAAFMAEDFAVLSPDGLQLRGDAVIELLIELLRFLLHHDPISASRIVQYRASLEGNDEDQRDPFAGQGMLADPVGMVRAWLAEHGHPRLRTSIQALLGDLAAMIDRSATSDAQLLTLLDEAHTWSTEHGQDIRGFLEHWERSGGDRTTAAASDSAAVQVMTMHKAKGLEFPVVIVPSSRMASTGSHASRLWIEPGAAIPELPRALVRESKSLRDAELPELLEEEHLSALDDLDLLYVAFTRPQQRLYAMVPEARPDGITTLLLDRIAQRGTDGKLMFGERTAPWNQRSTAQADRFRQANHSHSQALLTLRFEAPESWDPADPDPYRRYGNAVHQVLSQVEHAGMLRVAVDAAVEDETLDAEEAPLLIARLQAMLASQELSPFFGRHLMVRTEASIITAQGRLQRPDRLVFDGGTVRVLDIKTGAPDERHHEQVRGYMRLLSQLGHTSVEGALLYTSTGSLIPVAA